MLLQLLLFLIAILLVLTVGVSVLWFLTPDVRCLSKINPEETAFMRIRNREFKNESNQKKQKWLELPKMSPYIIQSVIVAEDLHFLTHKGFDWAELWYSFLAIIREKRIVKGGSGITQQLAKNLFLTPSRSVIRKIKEALITYKLERELTKPRILEIYLNVIEWGDNIYGVEAASRFYFNKSASELRLSEAIRLCTCTPNPRVLLPLDSSNDYLKSIQNEVLLRLRKYGRISQGKFIQTFKELHDFHESGYKPPVFIPFKEVSANLKTSDFWITTVIDPDKIIMNPEEIEIFNKRAGLISGGLDILNLPEYLCPKEIKEKIIEVSGLEAFFSPILENYNDPDDIEYIMSSSFVDTLTRYGADNQPLKTGFYLNIVNNLNVEGLNQEQRVVYALSVNRTDILAWPEQEFIMGKPFNQDFNILQQSSLDSAHAVAVIHSSKDSEWYFVRSSYVDGWVRARDLALTDRMQAMEYPGEQFLVVTSPNCRTESGEELHMGTKVSFSGKHLDYYEIKIPVRDKNGKLEFQNDLISPQFVNEGYLSYTKTNTIKLAFKFLGTGYSWGGYEGGVDCSSYIQKVFSVFGINLPRNSSAQTAVGRRISDFSGEGISIKTKLKQIKNWEPAITILGLPGHVMLYLGELAGKHYSIHAVWGITDRENRVVQINKVGVTDLGLGKGSLNGSLLERILYVSAIDLEPRGLNSLIRDFLFALRQHPWPILSVFKIIVIIAIALALFIIFL